MDSTTRALLVEVARTVLRVLGEGAEVAKAAPAPSSASTPAPGGSAWLTWAGLKKPEEAPAPAPGLAQRGDHVRIWTGDKYATGIVESIGRLPKTGVEIRRIKVRVKRAGIRDKLYTVDQTKAEIIKRGDA